MRNGTKQGGSLIGYIVVAVLLALALIGGLYGLQRWNAAQNITEQTAKSDEQTEPKDDGSATSGAGSEAKKESGAATEMPAAEPKAETPATSQQATPPATGSGLPQTGPADTALQLLVIAALVFASTSYLRSRSHR